MRPIYPPVYPPIGFHGDRYLLELVDFLADKVAVFIETGTNIAATLRYFASTYKRIKCYSCEPDKEKYQRACDNIKKMKNARVFNTDSRTFFNSLLKHKDFSFESPTLFWLDAHGGRFEWPLLFEISFITSRCNNAFVLIDDFQIPGKKQFQFDTYAEHVCSYVYVRNSINAKTKYRLYYPKYTEHTSKYHPLVGWGLIELYKNESLNIHEKLEFIEKSNA